MTANDRQWVRTQLYPLRTAIHNGNDVRARQIIHVLASEADDKKAVLAFLRPATDRVVALWLKNNT